MEKTHDNPDGVPAPAGPFSHVVRVDVGTGSLLYLAGQVALGDDGRIVGAGDMKAQAERVFELIDRLLRAHGADFGDVVKINTYLTDFSLRPELAEVYQKYLPSTPPASTAVEVSKLFLPEALVEIEVVAAVTHP